jgi:hypothetical protein
VVPDSNGVVGGKAALRAYWNAVLVIHYRNQSGDLVNDVLEFDDGLVRRGHGTYLVEAQLTDKPAPQSVPARWGKYGTLTITAENSRSGRKGAAMPYTLVEPVISAYLSLE